MGQQKFAVHIQADPSALASRNIGINELADSIRLWNVNMPTGTLFGQHTAYNVQANGQLMNAEVYGLVVVAYRNGAPVRLEQVARVIDSVEDDRTTSWMASRDMSARAINLMVMRQPGSNTIEVTDAIRKMMPFFQSQLPPSAQ